VLSILAGEWAAGETTAFNLLPSKRKTNKKATRRLLEINEIKEIPELILATVMSK
jgi:hypothetical protein